MGDWKDMFPASTLIGTPTTAPITESISDLDLRSEFNGLIYGFGGEDPIGQTFILKRMRRTSAGELTPCSCVDPVTLEPNLDFPCVYCHGRGYLYDEELVTGYKVIASSPESSGASANLPKRDFGKSYLPSIRFFFSYDIVPKIDDRIVEVELDSSGDLVLPINRIGHYEIALVRAMRGNGAGKIEFWACSTQRLGPKTKGQVG